MPLLLVVGLAGEHEESATPMFPACLSKAGVEISTIDNLTKLGQVAQDCSLASSHNKGASQAEAGQYGLPPFVTLSSLLFGGMDSNEPDCFGLLFRVSRAALNELQRQCQRLTPYP